MLLLCLGSITTVKAQGRYNLAAIDQEKSGGISINPLLSVSGIDWTNEGVEWADNTLGGSAGFGWGDSNGNSDTSFCFGAEYLHRITGEKQNPNGAGYLGVFANYHNASSDSFDENYLRAGLKYSYFDRFTAFNEVQLVYGANAYYETGSRDFSGFEDDITGYGASLYAGANFRLCDKVSLGVEVPVVSFLSRTFESNGNEFDQDNIWLGVNKDNTVSATLRWVLDELDKTP